MQGLWITCALLASAIVEVVLGNSGVLLPLTALTAFFFAVLRCWRMGLVLSWVAGSFVDLACGRPFPYSLLWVPMVVAVARIWRNYQLTSACLFQAIPGAVCGAVYSVVLLFLRWNGMTVSGLSALWPLVSKAGLTMLLSACVMPILVWLLDWASDLLGLLRYSRAGNVYVSGIQDAMDGEDADELP